MRAIGVLICLLIVGFCVFGYLATFEPSANAMLFRIGYVTVGFACLGGVLFLLFGPKRL